MLNRILLDTLNHLASQRLNRELVELRLTRYFTIAELDDGSVGACMSYYKQPDGVLDLAENRLQSYCHHDPFLTRNHGVLDNMIADCVQQKAQREFLLASLTASIASALSAAFIRNGGDEWFEVRKRCPENWTKEAETALVVGFGGLLKSLIAEENKVKNVHVIDLYYDYKSSGFREKLAALSAQHPEKCVTGSTHLESAAELQRFDLISITGSTLCNGTLEYFLTQVRSDAIVILQGQSASLHPKVLFEAGVSWVTTTLKPASLGQLAREGHDGEKMRPLLDGHLPPVYLVPRAPDRDRDRNELEKHFGMN